MLALLGKKQREHFVCIGRVTRRAEQKIYNRAPPYANCGGGGIVAGLADIQVVARVHNFRCNSERRIAGLIVFLREFYNIGELPAEIHRFTDAGIYCPVAHGNENIALFNFDG